MTYRMIVTKEFRPGGSGGPMARVGDLITLGETERRAYAALNWVKDAPAEEAAPDHSHADRYERRDMEAGDAPEPPAQKVAAKKTKRTYTRRNLTAK